MSNKTIFKRIALVAITALGAGILSVAPANAAAIVADAVDVAAVSGVTNAGACSVSTGGQGGTFVNGSLVTLTNASVDIDSAYVTLAGPAVWEGGLLVTTPGVHIAATLTSTTATVTNWSVANQTLTFRLNGLGAVTVTSAATSTSAAVDAFTVNSVSSCATSTYSAAKSNFAIVGLLETKNNDSTGTAWVTRFDNIDTPDGEIVANGGTGYIRAALRNEYGDNLSAKPIVVSTNNSACWVAVANTDATAGVATAPAATTAVATETGSDLTIAVTQSTAGTPANCTVTATWNGITVGTKTFKLQGVASTITVSDVTVGGVSGYGYYRATVKDALGNLLPGYAIAAGSATDATNIAALPVVSSTGRAVNTGTTTNASTGAKYGVTAAVTTDTITDNTVARYTCTAKGGAAKINVRALQSGVTYVTSPSFDVYCGGTTLNTWSMSFDKASYSPGEIATLTITGKDADGLLMSSLSSIGTLTQAFGGMTFVTAPTSADLFNSAAGAKSYQLSVGTTEGAFVGTMALTSAATDDSAKTIQYTIKSSTASVSNADVLKSIVSLIASINKQIQALQKLILKR
jgi:trimeric autotransporter adhesin